MNRIRINGIDIVAGRDISISGGRVVIDGKDVTPDAKDIQIEVSGNVDRLEVDTCNSLSITGDAGSISSVSGDVSVAGSVAGSVQTVSGDVDCGAVAGSISTISGDIKHRRP